MKNKNSYINLLFFLWRNLKNRRKTQIKFLIVLMLLSSFGEVFSLAAVVPFLSVLANPEIIWENPWVVYVRPFFNFTSPSDLLLPVTLLFGFSAILSSVLRLATFKLNGSLSAKIGSDISCEAYEKTLYQPYDIQVSRNSSGIIDALQIQVYQLITVIQSCLALLSSTSILISLLVTLLIIDFKVAILSGLLFGVAYGFVIQFANKKLISNSKRITLHNRLSMQTLQEGLGAIREVIMYSSQKIYLENYRNSDVPIRKLSANSVYLGVFPKYIMESLGVCLIGGVAYSLTTKYGGMQSALPLLGALALGAQRILPTVQQVYNSWAQIYGNKSAVEIVISYLKQPLPKTTNILKVEPYNFKNKISFNNVYFSYKNIDKSIIKGINFDIYKGERIGIIGPTGGGKSTTIDILMGLLKPTSGYLKVDNEDLHNSLNKKFIMQWRAAIAHVPQNIFLADKSIAENIAFGLPKDKIDMNQVIKSAERAQASNFIENMPKQYQTYIGERGIRLSGGQRQRIGIARALYKNSSVLIFDEATSSLDNSTEIALMNAIEKLEDELTIIMIAHRLSTVKNCNRIFEIQNGFISREGPPELILNQNN